MEAAGGFEPPNGGFADPCLTTWLRRLDARDQDEGPSTWKGPLFDSVHSEAIGAGNGARTRDLNLGKVALYQLSYSRPKQ